MNLQSLELEREIPRLHEEIRGRTGRSDTNLSGARAHKQDTRIVTHGRNQSAREDDGVGGEEKVAEGRGTRRGRFDGKKKVR